MGCGASNEHDERRASYIEAKKQHRAERNRRLSLVEEDLAAKPAAESHEGTVETPTSHPSNLSGGSAGGGSSAPPSKPAKEVPPPLKPMFDIDEERSPNGSTHGSQPRLRQRVASLVVDAHNMLGSPVGGADQRDRETSEDPSTGMLIGLPSFKEDPDVESEQFNCAVSGCPNKVSFRCTDCSAYYLCEDHMFGEADVPLTGGHEESHNIEPFAPPSASSHAQPIMNHTSNLNQSLFSPTAGGAFLEELATMSVCFEPCRLCFAPLADDATVYSCTKCTGFVICEKCGETHPTVEPDRLSGEDHVHVMEKFKREPLTKPKTRKKSVQQTIDVVKKRDAEGNKVINNYTVIRLLGRGANAKVKLLQHIVTGKLFAMKILRKKAVPRVPLSPISYGSLSDDESDPECSRSDSTKHLSATSRSRSRVGGGRARSASGTVSQLTATTNGSSAKHGYESILKEIATLKILSHPNIIELEEVIFDEVSEKAYIIMEYCERGPVFDTGDMPLDSETLRKAARGLLDGLLYLHSQHLYHRDVKPANCLTSSDGTIKIADFGTCQSVHVTDMGETVGTLPYMPPECFSAGGAHGSLMDSWAYAISVLEMCTGALPWDMTSNTACIAHITSPEPVDIADTVSDALRDMLTSLLDKNPQTRKTLSDIGTHPFFEEDAHENEVFSPVAARAKKRKSLVVMGANVDNHFFGMNGASKDWTQAGMRASEKRKERRASVKPPGLLIPKDDNSPGLDALLSPTEYSISLGFGTPRAGGESPGLDSITSLESSMNGSLRTEGEGAVPGTPTNSSLSNSMTGFKTPSKKAKKSMKSKKAVGTVEAALEDLNSGRNDTLKLDGFWMGTLDPKIADAALTCAKLSLALNELYSCSGIDFAMFQVLTHVRVTDNELVDFPLELLEAPELRVIDLSNNKIETLPTRAIGQHEKLTKVSLHNNRIETLESLGELRCSKSLVQVRVSSNPINTVDFLSYMTVGQRKGSDTSNGDSLHSTVTASRSPMLSVFDLPQPVDLSNDGRPPLQLVLDNDPSIVQAWGDCISFVRGLVVMYRDAYPHRISGNLFVAPINFMRESRVLKRYNYIVTAKQLTGKQKSMVANRSDGGPAFHELGHEDTAAEIDYPRACELMSKSLEEDQSVVLAISPLKNNDIGSDAKLLGCAVRFLVEKCGFASSVAIERVSDARKLYM